MTGKTKEVKGKRKDRIGVRREKRRESKENG